MAQIVYTMVQSVSDTFNDLPIVPAVVDVPFCGRRRSRGWRTRRWTTRWTWWSHERASTEVKSVVGVSGCQWDLVPSGTLVSSVFRVFMFCQLLSVELLNCLGQLVLGSPLRAAANAQTLVKKEEKRKKKGILIL